MQTLSIDINVVDFWRDTKMTAADSYAVYLVDGEFLLGAVDSISTTLGQMENCHRIGQISTSELSKHIHRYPVHPILMEELDDKMDRRVCIRPSDGVKYYRYDDTPGDASEAFLLYSDGIRWVFSQRAVPDWSEGVRYIGALMAADITFDINDLPIFDPTTIKGNSNV